LFRLADAGTYDERFKKWRYDDLPILPQEWQYIIPDDKKKQFDTLRSLMERPDVTGLVCATDAGREGELIFRFVYQMAGCKKPFQRLWISSMEDAAIKDGFAHLKPGTDYDNLYQSALCRAQADWLVGINATRLFSILYHKTLTVGRVQTPTLKMLVDREAKISSFQKEKYHIVQIAAGGMEAASERMRNADDAKALKCFPYFFITDSVMSKAKRAYGFLCRPQPKNCKQPCGKSESAPTIHRTFFYMGIEAHRSDLLSCPVIWCCPQAWMN